MPTEAPLSTLAAEGGRAYLGYRAPGGITVRRPAGARERFSAGAASAALAEAVLSDRLGHEPPQALVEAFSREWVEPRARSEFVWPVVAVDEWLAAQNADDARPTTADRRSRRALRRTLDRGRHDRTPALAERSTPHQSLTPQGGH